MLLDRLDELPLRRHEIRGNPAGLLARLLADRRLKAERIDDARRRGQPRRRPRGAGAEFAELCAAHDRILAEAGSLDRGDVFLALDCLLVERPDVRAADRRRASRS